MNATQIENNVQELIQSINEDTFIFDFLLAYDTPKSIVKKLKDFSLNLSKENGEVLWKKKLFFKVVANNDLHLTIDEIKTDPKITNHSPRFVLVTDYNKLLAVDTKTLDSLDISILDFGKHFDFFLPLAGMEKAAFKSENPADVKAAEKMAKLYDEIKKDNPTVDIEEVHGLNVFLSRLLFCFFAEDTEIYKTSIFTNTIKSHTQNDGSDLKAHLERLFEVLNTDNAMRNNLPEYLNAFPYVNGGLFKDPLNAPIFTYKSRSVLIECGELNWKDINPDIFGSMIQAVITPEHRGGLGMHYTSVPNIMKVIEPLFLTELKEEFEASKNQPRKLDKLLYRLSKIKIFDPACGSGNFLIIAYKELRMLEIDIIKQLEQLQQAVSGFEEKQLALIPKAQQSLAAMYHKQLFSNIQLTQFYGIELDDFAHEIAILSLWLAQHQMNMKFKEVLGQGNPTLPLKESGNIAHGNATRINWEKVCPKKEGDEIYILGNPPYLGSSLQSADQKEDMAIVFKGITGYKNLDYISCWFLKGANFIRDENAELGLVSTNSVCQGEQVALLWPIIFSLHLEIGFAYTSFKWKNSAKANAGVSVIIVAIRNAKNKTAKYIYTNEQKILSLNINPYLANAQDVIVSKRALPLSSLPVMTSGIKAGDGGNLILSVEEKDRLLSQYPQAGVLIRNYVGADDFMNSKMRYCLWVEENDKELAYSIPPLKQRFENCQSLRASSKKVATQKKALVPHQFDETTFTHLDALLIPQTGSERRNYIPVGYQNSGTIISNAARAIYNAQPFIFAIISSRMHIAWIKKVAGRLKTDMQYSNTLCYNTFPFPIISDFEKQELGKHVYRIIEEREAYPEKTLAELYDPDKMPDGLREAHHQNDLAVERCYRTKPFESDEGRLEYLFKLYEQMIAEEKENGTLFANEKKAKKKK